MKRHELTRLLPPGFPLYWELAVISIGAVVATCWSAQFFFWLFRARNGLYDTVRGVRVLREGAVMLPFPMLLHSAFLLFPVLALCALACTALHYASYYQGGRSIYTMRRLPRRSELHLRCWALPVLLSAAVLLLAILLRLGYFAIYLSATPPGCLPPDAWGSFWRG